MVGGNMFANVINYIYQIYFAGRFLGPAGNGQLGSLFAILYVVTIIPMSTSPAIIKFVSSAKNDAEVHLIYQKIYRFVVKLALILSLILLLISPIISSFIHVQVSSVLIIPFVLFISLVTLVNQSTLQGVLRFWGSVGPNIVSSAGKLIFGILFVLLGWYVFGAMVGVLVSVALSFLYSWYLMKKFTRNTKPKGKFDFNKFLKYSLPVLIQSFAFTSLFTTDIILVKHFFPDSIAGQYVALSTLGKIIFFAASPIAGVMFPMVSGRHSKGEKYFHLLMISLSITLLISLGAVSFYFLIPKTIIGLSYGSKYLSVAGDLPWMGLFLCFYTISFFMVNFFLSIDEIKIATLPLVFSILQAFLIYTNHSSLLQVIQISLGLMLILFVTLFVYLVYNRFKYAKIQI